MIFCVFSSSRVVCCWDIYMKWRGATSIHTFTYTYRIDRRLRTLLLQQNESNEFWLRRWCRCWWRCSAQRFAAHRHSVAVVHVVWCTAVCFYTSLITKHWKGERRKIAQPFFSNFVRRLVHWCTGTHIRRTIFHSSVYTWSFAYLFSATAVRLCTAAGREKVDHH